MSLYEDQFDAKHDLTYEGEKPSKYLIIASTARSGSHMLGHALHATGQFGYPLEYVNPANLSKWKELTKANSFEKVIECIKQRRTSPNGVFSIKIHYSHLKQFGGYEKIKEYFPNAHIVFISRKNVLKQAVSFAIASQNGNWISGQAKNEVTHTYDERLIKKIMKRTMLENASWRFNLLASGDEFLEMEFESISKDIPSAVQSIADFMNIEIPESSIPQQPTTTKQSTTINKEWEERFISNYRSGEDISADLRGMYEQGGLMKKLKRVVKSILG